MNEDHAQKHPGHKVIKLDPWPPKRRLHPTRRLTPPKKLPASVDLVQFWVSVNYPQPNQGNIGDCTAETLALDVALMKIKQGIYKAPFSVAFAYWGERVNIGTFPQDSGANMADEGNEAAKQGLCFESSMPTSQTSCNAVPSPAATSEAANYRCDPNQQAIAVADFQIALYNSLQNPLLGSVRMGFPVGNTFFDAATNNGWVPNTPTNDSLAGGHSMDGGGYFMLQAPNDSAPRLYLVFIQSWGATGDMSRGISIYKFQYPEFFTSQFVQDNQGIDAYQQPDLPSTLNASITFAANPSGISPGIGWTIGSTSDSTLTSKTIQVPTGTVINVFATTGGAMSFTGFTGLVTSPNAQATFTASVSGMVTANYSGTPPTPKLTLTGATSTLVNNGSVTIDYTVAGVSPNDSVGMQVIGGGSILTNINAPTPTNSTVSGNIGYVGSYMGSAYLQAFDYSVAPASTSNQFPVTISAPPTPNPCPIAALANRILNRTPIPEASRPAVAKTLNAIPIWFKRRFPFVRLRRGRFYYTLNRFYYMNP